MRILLNSYKNTGTAVETQSSAATKLGLGVKSWLLSAILNSQKPYFASGGGIAFGVQPVNPSSTTLPAP